MGFYYNSVKEILTMHDISLSSTYETLTYIEDKLRYDMICPFRTVLHVYSQKWPAIHQFQQLPSSLHNRTITPSIHREVRSILLFRSLNEWLSKIRSVMANIEKKLD